MNGPEHYREAERLLKLAADAPAALVNLDRDNLTEAEVQRVKEQAQTALGTTAVIVGPGVSIDVSPALRAAQIHATLAQAAATAHSAIHLSPDGETAEKWYEVIGANR